MATIVRNSSAAVGDSVMVTSVMSVNGTDVTIDTVALTITSIIDTAEDIDIQVNRLLSSATVLSYLDVLIVFTGAVLTNRHTRHLPGTHIFLFFERPMRPGQINLLN